ncbi:MAG: Hsp20/alpha crystallin family protein [Candidatus Omnitrophica bacterium]|nr:Hsp20/alpha crystallin family protein [Candidatus Omnitrophota bacterium]
MALVPYRKRERWDPFYELEKLQNEMNRLFNFSLTRWPERDTGLLEGMWSPAVDVYDSKDTVLVRADIPGMKKEELDISVQGDILVIKGEKKREGETKEKDYIRSERFYGSFNRAIALPVEVDPNKVAATYKGGVLEITLTKKETAKPKQIKIDVR